MKRYILGAVALLFCGVSQANELDRFKKLLQQSAGNNYYHALRTTSSEQKRDYVRNLTELKKVGSSISRHLTRYKKYPEIKRMNVTEMCHKLLLSYNSAAAKPAEAAAACKRSGGGKFFVNSNAEVSQMVSDNAMERDRLGALYLLFKWTKELKQFNYPDVEIPDYPAVAKYTMLLSEFEVNAKLLGGTKDTPAQKSSGRKSSSGKKLYTDISDYIKSDIRAGFRDFSAVASSLQKEGMRRGFSISKYVAKVSAFVNATNIRASSSQRKALPQEIRDDYNYAMGKLRAFGQELAADPPAQRSSSTSSMDAEVGSRVTNLQLLKDYRRKLLDADPNAAGLALAPETIQSYLRSLSKAEYSKYKSVATDYLRKGYAKDRAKTTAIKMLQGYMKSGRVKISSSELEDIVSRLDLSDENADTTEYVDAPDDEESAEKDQLAELKRIRVMLMKRNYNLTGLWSDKFSVSNYEKTLSSKEKDRYKKHAKQYKDKGYEDHRAKSSAINLIHSLFMTGTTKIPEKELSSILKRCESLLEKLEEEDSEY